MKHCQFCPISLFAEGWLTYLNSIAVINFQKFHVVGGSGRFQNQRKENSCQTEEFLRQDVTLRSNANEQMLRQSFKRIVNIDPTPTFALLSVSWFVLLHLTPAAVVHAQP